MADKLPADFNPDAYAAAYPDVALSGLGARAHYLRFGRLLGRSPSGKAAGGKGSDTRSPPAAPSQAAKSSSPDQAVQRPVDSTAAPRRKSEVGPAIIERPDDFRPEDVVPSPAPVKSAGQPDGSFGLDDFLPKDGDRRSSDPLRAFALMVGTTGPTAAEEPSTPNLCDPLFKSGEVRIENCWFADGTTLRLTIAGAQQHEARYEGWAVRAFQAFPDSRARLHPAGQGIQLPRRGPCFVDVPLLNPLMPLLVELAEPGGRTVALALLPFPSLLPGGLHWAEAKALQASASPMDSFWSLSDHFFGQLIGARKTRPRLIVRSEPHEPAVESTIHSAEVGGWLEVMLGSGEAAPGDLELMLPPDAVPTIAALVSPRLTKWAGAAWPYLVAETDSRRPIASVALPAGFERPAHAPHVESRDGAQGEDPERRAPIHLAILYRRAEVASSETAGGMTAAKQPLSIFLDAADPARAEALVGHLQVSASELDLWVRSDGGDDMSAALDRACGAGRWQMAAPQESLRDVARRARHDVLVTIDDRVRLDGDILSRLASLLGDDGDIASASCLLLGEIVIKKQAVLQAGSGGLFPAGVSFITGPTMSFAEPDVSNILRDMTYPVVANTLHLTAWRRSILADLPMPADPVPRSAEDIELGLTLTRAGYRNLCTTRLSATMIGNPVRRDAIDPLGSAILQPGRWQELLDRVTLVRELF